MRSDRSAVVVTGATGGIGGAICTKLIDTGYVVIAQYRSDEGSAEQLRRRAADVGGTCILVRTDLRKEDAIDDIIAAVTRSEEDGIHVRGLVNNAAKLLSPSFADTRPLDFDEYFAINAKAPLFLAQALVPRMKAGGSIVNISSASAHFSSPGDLVYAMSKAALESLTVNIAEAIAPDGIRVNCVIPGFTDNGHRAFSIPQAREYMSSFSVLGGVSRPQDIAAVVLFLLSDRASRITGTGIDASGGSTLGARGNRPGSVIHLLD